MRKSGVGGDGTRTLGACSKSGILALQTPKFYLAGSKRARKSVTFAQALAVSQAKALRNVHF
jgi:hypothetical protein